MLTPRLSSLIRNVGVIVNSYERRLEKLEVKRAGPPEPITIVRLMIDPQRGAVSALWRADNSKIERGADESEEGFRARVAGV